MSAKAILSASVSAPPVYVEDVFSTFLYIGSSSAQTITNGIDLSGKGGLVWLKGRSVGSDSGYGDHELFDSSNVGSTRRWLNSRATDALGTNGSIATAPFTTSGFNLDAGPEINNRAGDTNVSWTFRKAAKFFDVVTYTGDGNASKTISHNLGSTPGFLIVKRTDAAGQWQCYHRSLTSTSYYIQLNQTSAQQTLGSQVWGVSSTNFTVYGAATDTNINNATYVAYVFAHDAGGFGTAGTDNVVSCGTFTTDGSGAATVSLGYEPQWLLMKRSDSSTGGTWFCFDVMRGWGQTQSFVLNPNDSGAETTYSSNPSYITPTSTGFQLNTGLFQPSGTYIYIAIRRGPMKTPTVGTQVFALNEGTGSTSGQSVTTNFPVDMDMTSNRTLGGVATVGDRMRGYGNTDTAGATPTLTTSSTAAEATGSNPNFYKAWNTTITRGSNGADPGGGKISWFFRRAPGFFDVVAYTGTGVNRNITHNLTTIPELIIVKSRSNVEQWPTWSSAIAYGSNNYLSLASAVASGNTDVLNYWDTVAVPPTSTTFAVGTHARVNASSVTYIAYLFATAPGVSKVGSYTGNGTTQTIDCGFTGGARFVLIKRTDAAGAWYVYDTARGMTVLTDPYLLLNTTAAEVATLGSVTTVSTGFALNSTILADINISAGTYIFLAIA